MPFTFSTFQPLLSIFNETSRFAPRYFERVDLSFLDAYNHPFSHELLPANCRLCPLPTAAALFMIREGIHSPPGDDQRRQGIGFHQSFILCPKGWRGRKRPFQFSRRSKVFWVWVCAFLGGVIIIIIIIIIIWFNWRRNFKFEKLCDFQNLSRVYRWRGEILKKGRFLLINNQIYQNFKFEKLCDGIKIYREVFNDSIFIVEEEKFWRKDDLC